jgi:hypothetical protein
VLEAAVIAAVHSRMKQRRGNDYAAAGDDGDGDGDVEGGGE